MNTMLVHFGVDFEPIQRPNVHTEVIRPQFPQLQKEKRSIEVEIHVIISPSKINASILFHKVRITAVLDLLLELKSFVFDDVPEEDVPKELCKYRQCSESITSGGTYELSRTSYSKNCGYYAVTPRTVVIMQLGLFYSFLSFGQTAVSGNSTLHQ